MRARLAAAPFWVYGLVSGVLFGTAMTVFSTLRGDGGSWSLRIVMGVLAGILFGVGMGVVMRRDFGTSRDELAALPIEQRRAVLRAAGWGAAADVADPAARAVAAGQVQRLLNLNRRRARFPVVGASLAMVVYAAMALTRSPWWWFAFMMFAAAIAAQFAMPRRLERRLAALSAPPRP